MNRKTILVLTMGVLTVSCSGEQNTDGLVALVDTDINLNESSALTDVVGSASIRLKSRPLARPRYLRDTSDAGSRSKA